LEECLLLQIDDFLAHHEEAPDEQACGQLAKRLVQGHLAELGSLPVTSLAKACGEPKEAVSQALALIRGLEPKPAATFQSQQATYLIPDVLVQRDRRGRWTVRLARHALPRLSINSEYAKLIKDNGGDGGLQQKLQEARWMMKNIQQRSDTILRVSQAIVAAQQKFFEEGPKSMRPMVLRDIAEACELHESTVSRVTTQKFMLTPLGCFELKYFFSSHVGTDDGGAASATALRAQIQDWIKAEPAEKPLSDQAIADRFAEQGVVVARRTVAKYREGLRIPSASLRKRA
jgi:RNA polymerase sigma-54 factor